MPTRKEHDFIGELEIDDSLYYGIQTLRAVENFNISHEKLKDFPGFVKALAQVKKAAALANGELGLLDYKIQEAICWGCDQIIAGKYIDQFVVDMIQGGAGTSTNMNANEVIANLALEHMGHKKGEYKFCHPNDHVNLGQSTNDAYPTALRVAIYERLCELTDAMRYLVECFNKKAHEFRNIIKMGRTEMQDAVPMTLGQEFKTYAVMLGEDIERVMEARNLVREMNLGGTAIGTGINSHPDYPTLVEAKLQEVTGRPFIKAGNLIEATQDTGAYVQISGVLKRVATKLGKICADLRLLSSGPRCGFNEINLPKIQPGSSIMPGKVNPVIPEVVQQVCYKVIGNDTTVMLGSENAQLELNAFEPVMVYSIFESIELLINGINTLIERCINGIEVDEKRCHSLMQHSTTIVTAFNPYIGYKASTELSKECLERDMGIYDLILEKKILTKEQVDLILKPENLIKPIKLNIETGKKEEEKK